MFKTDALILYCILFGQLKMNKIVIIIMMMIIVIIIVIIIIMMIIVIIIVIIIIIIIIIITNTLKKWINVWTLVYTKAATVKTYYHESNMLIQCLI